MQPWFVDICTSLSYKYNASSFHSLNWLFNTHNPFFLFHSDLIGFQLRFITELV